MLITLILYLRREDRREGYPLEEDPSGRVRTNGGLLFTAAPKTFRLPFGWGEYTAPNGSRDDRTLNAERTNISPGSPSVPTGNPMLAGVGPGSYAERAKVVDQMVHGGAKIVPLRVATDFSILRADNDPHGFPVLGTDGVIAGSIVDVWVDRAEVMIRYLEVGLADGSRNVLLPMTMAVINKRLRLVKVDAITAAQFADVPGLANPDEVTFYEEERITAYYGAGFLYATPDRAEPLL
jgi:photosynthetic reaction center H subunit